MVRRSRRNASPRRLRPTPAASHLRRDVKKAYYLREIIEQGIEEMEDYYLAADVLERVRKGQELVHTAADVRKDLGLDD